MSPEDLTVKNIFWRHELFPNVKIPNVIFPYVKIPNGSKAGGALTNG
jgi:hypothetical protein